MLKKLPIAACPLNVSKIITANPANITGLLKSHIKQNYITCVSSGSAALLIALLVLKERSLRHEVIIPAYTSGSLIAAIKQAGLTPVLSDISLADFNIDMSLAESTVTADTLAIIPVHGLGIPVSGIKEFKQKFEHVWIIEDCAQSLGSTKSGLPVGQEGDIAIYSFGRGKNITAYQGGAIATNNASIGAAITKQSKKISAPSRTENILVMLKIITLKIVTNPWIYGLLDRILARFKEGKIPAAIPLKKISLAQEKTLASILPSLPILSAKRYKNGTCLISKLHTSNKVTIPIITNDMMPAFNRIPILIKDKTHIQNIIDNLKNNGIEASRLYYRPLHHICNTGNDPKEFPQSIYLAEHLITLPAHPAITERDIEKITNIILSQNE